MKKVFPTRFDLARRALFAAIFGTFPRRILPFMGYFFKYLSLPLFEPVDQMTSHSFSLDFEAENEQHLHPKIRYPCLPFSLF